MSNVLKEDLVDAIFSDDGKHRFALWRIWEPEKPLALFICLNPSRGAKLGYGPTTNNIVAILKNLGYGGVYIGNLFSRISVRPTDLQDIKSFRCLNYSYLKHLKNDCKDVFFAWGSYPLAKERSLFVIKMFPEALCLGKNKDGAPTHPIYLSNKITPIKYR